MNARRLLAWFVIGVIAWQLVVNPVGLALGAREVVGGIGYAANSFVTFVTTLFA